MFKNGSADIRSKVAAITASAGRCPVSAQCELLGVPRSTCYRLRDEPEDAGDEDPIADAVEEEFDKSGGRYGARRIKRALDELFEVFGITRSLSEKGCPFDNAVDESTDKTSKAEFVYREQLASLRDLRLKSNDYVRWYDKERMHSTLGCMSPVEFRKAGLSL